MSGVAKINIVESAPELKSLLSGQKTASAKERVQALYLLKTNQVSSVKHLAIVLGRSRITVQRWLRLYRDGGLEAMLKVPQRTGRPRQIPEWAIARLKSELAEPEGFNSYQEVVVWLSAVLDIQVSYDVVYYLVHDVLKAKLKVARPKSEKQDPSAQEKFKKKLAEIIENLISAGVTGLNRIESIRYWCQDETRLGLKTIGGRKLTAPGVKPIGFVQWDFLAYWLYGLVEPKTGASFFWEFSHLDTTCCERFFVEFARAYPNDLHIIQLDNSPAHTSKKLQLPENVILLFQPPHSPETNPIERLWQYLKSFLIWATFDDLDSLKNRVASLVKSLSKSVVKSICGWSDILEALSVAGL